MLEYDGVLILQGDICFQLWDWPAQGSSFSQRSAAGKVTSQNRVYTSCDKNNNDYYVFCKKLSLPVRSLDE